MIYCLIPIPIEPEAKLICSLLGGGVPFQEARARGKGKWIQGKQMQRGALPSWPHLHQKMQLGTQLWSSLLKKLYGNITPQKNWWEGRKGKYLFACFFTSTLSCWSKFTPRGTNSPYLLVVTWPFEQLLDMPKLMSARGPSSEWAMDQERASRNQSKNQEHSCLPMCSLMPCGVKQCLL